MKQQEPLEFDEKTHRYFRGDQERVGLTTLLRSYFGTSKYYTQRGRELGSALHLACQFLAEDTLDWDTLEPEIVEQAKAYRRFIQETGFFPQILEAPYHSMEIDVATKPDQVGLMMGRLSVVEIKRGAVLKQYELQTAGQKIILKDNDVDVQDRYGLYLKKNGKYSLEKHPNDFQDEDYFRILAKAYHEPDFAEYAKDQIKTIQNIYGG